MIWTINDDTFASKGLGNLQRTLQNQQADLVSCQAVGAAVDDDALFPEGSSVVIKKDDVIWFTGRCISVPRQGSPTEENNTYQFAGPWWYLENKVFQQQWLLYNADPEVEDLELQYKSRVILGQTSSGTPQSLSAAITEILTYAINDGVPFTIGTISPSLNVYIPMDEAIDIMCAEALRRLLRWAPNAVCWFDYSTVVPSFNCKLRTELAAATFDLDKGAPNNAVDIRARTDLQVSAVVLKYEQVNVVDGEAYQTLITEAYPADATGRELGAVNMTIQLNGSNLSFEKSTIVVEALPADLNDITWWTARLSELSDPMLHSVSIHDADRVYDETPGDNLPNELKKGSIYPWMGGHARMDEITAYLDYVEYFEDASGVHQKIVNKLIKYKYMSTDLTSKTYKRVDNFSSGESVPTGLALAYYNSVHPLQHEGSIVLIEEDVSGVIYPGKVLNITNGLPVWASMNAYIHTVVENVDDGITRISFGPAAYLGPADLIELHRANRGRQGSSSWQARDTGLAEDAASSVSEEDAYTPMSSVHTEAGEIQQEIVRYKGATYNAKIIIDPELAKDIKADADINIQPRELDVCVDGVVKKVIFMCSEPYDPPAPA